MKKGKKLLRWGILLVASLFLFSACGARAYDASGYVKSMLDSQTRGEFDQYVKLTDSTKEEAQELYDENIEVQMDSMEEYGLSDELMEKYRELFKNMFKQSKYTVGEAKKGDDDSFTVPVEVEKFQLFEGLDEELDTYQEELETELTNQMIETGVFPEQEEIMEKVFQHLYDLLNERVENPTYGEKATVEVKVSKNGDDIYEADESDMEEIGNKLVDSDDFAI